MDLLGEENQERLANSAGIEEHAPDVSAHRTTADPSNLPPCHGAGAAADAGLPSAVNDGAQAGDASLATISQFTETVLYAPGYEDTCRAALDRAVAADRRVFTLEGSDVLAILRTADPATQIASTQWGSDLPALTLATVADTMEIAERIQWTKHGKSGRRHPPRNFVADYLQQMRGRYGARKLRGIARVPRIDDNGDIHFVAGYDDATRLYHDQTPTFVVPPAPSQQDVDKAATALLLPFSEYQFEDTRVGKALLLGAIFTAIERPFVPTAPMVIARSSMAGTGKGLLVKGLVQLAYGTTPVVATWGANPEETEKRIGSLLLQAAPAICIDNANGKMIQGDLLESIITEGRADIRVLGRSEMVRVNSRSLLLLTGNNPHITGDMARRTLALDIKPRSSDPERDRYKFNPVELIRSRRTTLLMAAFTIMRAYRKVGMPSGGLPAVGSFELWSRRVRDLVFWLTSYDLADAFRQNKAEDPRRQDDASLLHALHDLYGTAAFKSSDVFGIYSAVANSRRTGSGACDPKKEALYDAMDAVLGSHGVSAKQFGHWARRVNGGHVGGFQLTVRHNPRTNSNAITVHRT